MNLNLPGHLNVNLILLIFHCLFFGYLQLNAQQITELRSDDFAQLTITSNTVYDGNALWGYMNGGADLYLEYGFAGLRVQEVEFASEKIKLEIFTMESPKAAFGIMSIRRFKCAESELFVTGDCLTDYQYQAAKSNFYISIINYNGSEKAGEITRILARKLLGKISGESYPLPSFQNIDPQFVTPNTIKLATGPLGIQNIVPKWAKLFEGTEHFDLFVFPVKTDNGKILFGDLLFADKEIALAFINRNFDPTGDYPVFITEGDKTIGLQRFSDTWFRIAELNGSQENSAKILKQFGF